MSDTQQKVVARPLRQTLLFWFLVLSVVPLLIVTGISYLQASSELREGASAQLLQGSELKTDIIENWFSYRLMDLSLLATVPDNGLFAMDLAQAYRNSGQTLEDFVGSDEWQWRIEADHKRLLAFLDTYDYVYDVFVTDGDGNILYTVVREDDLGTNLFRGQYSDTRFAGAVRRSVEIKTQQFSGMERYEPSNFTFAGFLTAPMVDANGNMLGVIAVQLQLDRIFNTMQKTRTTWTSERHFLTDSDGTLLTPAEGDWNEVLNKQVPLEREGVGAQSDQIEIVRNENRDFFRIVRPLRVLNQTWLLVSEVAVDEVVAPVEVLAQIQLLVLFSTCIAVLLVALYLARRITLPLVRLTEASSVAASGASIDVVDVRDRSEIGVLAAAFNDMVQQEQSQQAEIERANVELSRLLSDSHSNQVFQDLVLESIPDLFFVKDYESRIIRANEKFLAQYPEDVRDSVIGGTALEIFEEQDRRAFLEADQQAFADGYTEVHDDILLPNGERHSYITRKIRFDNEQGEAFLLGLATDVTELKRGQWELAKSEERFQVAVEGSSDGLWDWDIDSSKMYYSPRIRQMLGYAGDDFENFPDEFSSFESHLHPDDHDRVTAEIQHHLETGATYDVEYRLRQSDGEYCFFRARGVALRDDKGRPIRMAGSISDVSAYKTQQQKLEQAMQAAEAASIAKSQFLASMSHEIRTPMNAVLGMLAFLDKTRLNDDQRHRLSIAASSAKSLLSLIDDILDLTKIDADKMDIDSIDFNLRQLVDEVAQSFAQPAQSKGLELIVDTAGITTNLVRGDPGRVRQCLTNLMGNAVKFTERGEIMVSASLAEAEGGLHGFVCEVKDTGIGVSQQKLESLFDPFTQADSSTTRQFGGSGLGLAIVKRLCALMGGDVDVSSEPGEGSRFQMQFELAASPAAQTVGQDCARPSGKLLMLESHSESRDVLLRQWQAFGLTADAVSDIELLRAALDLESAEGEEMPVGLLVNLADDDSELEELLRGLQSQASKSDLLKVVMTSMAHTGDHEFFASLGVDLYYPKPLTTDNLLEIIAALAERQSADAKITEGANEVVSALEEVAKPESWAEGLEVLLVEDNRINQMVVCDILEDLGIEVETAMNGVEALEKMRTRSSKAFDLVLMDCQMPEMDGYEASACIRRGDAGEDCKNIIIIALTAHAMAGDRQKCLDAGMDDYATKPIDEDALVDKMRHALEGRSQPPK